MDFFRAYEVKGVKTPTYFIESTAPDNVDDDTPPQPLPPDYVKWLSLVDSEKAVERIARVLAEGDDPNLVVMVHGFNNPQPDVLKMYTSAALAIERYVATDHAKGLVCVGYRWPSEKMGEPTIGARKALPTLASWILTLGLLLVLLSVPLYFVQGAKDWMLNWLSRLAEHGLSLAGWTAAGLMVTAILLRIIVYFRDNYRASNYGIPDLIQVIRAIDSEVKDLREKQGGHHRRHVQLSFIGHSMGGFVVTNTIRTLSDVFSAEVKLNEFGAAGAAPNSGIQQIGNVFQLKRFVLASPDIPAEALLSSRGNFLASALSRFEEAYLFSNEGDEVLRQISTLANYFVFPARSKNHGFRLGNVEILSSGYGFINPAARGGLLQTLRIGNLTLDELYQALEQAEGKRQETYDAEGKPQPEKSEEPPARVTLPEVFSYFDCTDYVDQDDPDKPDERPLLTFAKRRKRNDPTAKLRWFSHLNLLFAYIAFGQKPNVHGGYFQGVLSQQLIYRLACLGYHDAVGAFGTEAALRGACEKKQIRALLSPTLQGPRIGPAVARAGMRRPYRASGG